MNKRIHTAGVEAGRTDGPPDTRTTTGGSQSVAYEQATSVAASAKVSTEETTLPNSRTVVTRARSGSLKLRYSPIKTPVERLPTS